MAGPEPPVARLHVVLVHPEIAWNTGNAGRTCLAAGAQLHLVRPLGFSLDEREVRRAAVDYWPRVRPLVWQEWSTFEAQLPEMGEPFLFSAEAPRELWDVSFPPAPVLIFGGESGGLPDELRRRYAAPAPRAPRVSRVSPHEGSADPAGRTLPRARESSAPTGRKYTTNSGYSAYDRRPATDSKANTKIMACIRMTFRYGRTIMLPSVVLQAAV
jgi:tRNA (cytidine/uridine-2'-O-)-methyltransferase